MLSFWAKNKWLNDFCFPCVDITKNTHLLKSNSSQMVKKIISHTKKELKNSPHWEGWRQLGRPALATRCPLFISQGVGNPTSSKHSEPDEKYSFFFGCQIAANWWLGLCDISHLLLHCHLDCHTSKMADKLTLCGSRSRVCKTSIQIWCCRFSTSPPAALS